MNDEEAAFVPVGGTNALHFLKKAAIQPGQKILIYGTSGSIGTFAIQLAKHFGAEITSVCSTDKIELLKGSGTQKVIDYKKEDFTQNSERCDVIFDTVGKSPFAGSLKSLIETGKSRSVIDRCYPLEQMAEARRYVEKGHKRGNAVVIVK